MARNMNFRILYNVRSDRISDRPAGIYLFSHTIVFGTETAQVLRFRRVDTPLSRNRLYNITGGRLGVWLIFGGGFRFTVSFISLASTDVIFPYPFVWFLLFHHRVLRNKLVHRLNVVRTHKRSTNDDLLPSGNGKILDRHWPTSIVVECRIS